MEPVTTAALVSAGAGLASGVMNNMVNYGMSKKLMQKQYDLNMKAWHAQNEYNLPVNQMQRLADAGLNPHLVYQNGGASATASTPSSTSQGHFNSNFSFDPLGDLSNYQSIMNMRANQHYTNVQATQAELTGRKQRELMDAQINNLNTHSQVNTENAYTQGLTNSFIRAFTGDDKVQRVGDTAKGLFDRGAEAVGDFLYWLSGNREYYQSHTAGHKLNRARLY